MTLKDMLEKHRVTSRPKVFKWGRVWFKYNSVTNELRAGVGEGPIRELGLSEVVRWEVVSFDLARNFLVDADRII